MLLKSQVLGFHIISTSFSVIMYMIELDGPLELTDRMA